MDFEDETPNPLGALLASLKAPIRPAIRPVTASEAREFLSVVPLNKRVELDQFGRFKLGDLVRLRVGFRHSTFPEPDQVLTISQVLPQALHHGERNSSDVADPLDIAILCMATKIDDGSNFIVEHLFDSRRFESVDGRNIWSETDTTK